MDENNDENYENDDEYDEFQLDADDDEINENIATLMKDYDKNKLMYRAKHKLTKFEKTRIISERSCMLSNNSKPIIENPERYSNSYDIALAEFNEGKLPFIVKRKYGNTYEYWKLIDLL
tara:strand:+ start:49 stop:405 length:357 start_codon:yes stop_codon:yes gene_type:complete